LPPSSTTRFRSRRPGLRQVADLAAELLQIAPDFLEPEDVPHGNADSVQARIHRDHVHGVLPHRALGPITGTIVYRSAAGSPMSSSRLAQFVASRTDCMWL